MAKTGATRTPITDDVREQKGDYLASVEALELSHTRLLKAVKGILPHLQSDLDCHDAWTKEIEALEKAVEAAKRV